MTRRRFTGHTASSGIAVGVLHRVDHPSPTTPPVSADEPAGDPGARLTKAFEAVAERLLASAEKLRAQDQGEQADILEVIGYLAMDPDLRQQAIEFAQDGAPLTAAVQRAVDQQAEALAALPDPTLAERAADVRQVGKRVVAELTGAGSTHWDSDTEVVLAAEEIGAADLLEPMATVAAAVSVTGGPNSHAAIVARSLGIPLVVGVDRSVLELADGSPVVVDSDQGTAIVDPEEREWADAVDAMRTIRRRREALALERDLPAQTVDGHSVTLRANVATPAETRAALAAHAEGVGLLRTELPFLDATEWPSEEQHAAVLGPILRLISDQPVVVRTLDFADDKLPPFLAKRRTGRLGRGLPLMLAEPSAFARQFRAIVRTGAGRDVRIMIPMVAEPSEFDACRALLEEAVAGMSTGVRGEARVESAAASKPPLGVMIELPEAVRAADALAERADFLSIGSNDLTGQLLGMHRRDPAFTPALAAHPRVLRAIADTVTSAHRYGRPVSVCGDAASDPLVLPLLVGLDCDVLSVAPARVDEVRGIIRRLEYATCARVAAQARDADTVERVWDLVREHCSPTLPGGSQ